jgi:uncharacterized protein (TIGR03435 family)
MQRILSLIFGSILGTAPLSSQAPIVDFEVASVKPALMPNGIDFRELTPPEIAALVGFDGGPGTSDPTRIYYHRLTLRALLARAFGLAKFQAAGPDWLDAEVYTIEAKVPLGTDEVQLRLMLQRLLTARFQIRLHRETRETRLYLMKVTKEGPKLQALIDAESQGNGLGGPGRRAPTRVEPYHHGLIMPRAAMEQFAYRLSSFLGRPVKDMTSLTGLYSFSLTWSDLDHSRINDPREISAAMREQLGLELQDAREGIEYLIIDQADRTPIAN